MTTNGYPEFVFNLVQHADKFLCKTFYHNGSVITKINFSWANGCDVTSVPTNLDSYIKIMHGHQLRLNRYALPSNVYRFKNAELVLKDTFGDVSSVLEDNGEIVKDEELETGRASRGKKRSMKYIAGKPTVVTFDHDFSDDVNDKSVKLNSSEDLWKALNEIAPGVFTGVARAGYYSSGSWIYDKDGKEFTGARGHHTVVVAKDAGDVERFRDVLFKRCWLAGYGHIMIDASVVPKLLPRTIFDVSVIQSQQPVYVGGARCLDGLSQRRPPPTIYHGDYLDTRRLEDLTPDEEQRYAEMVSDAKAARQPEADEIAERRGAEQGAGTGRTKKATGTKVRATKAHGKVGPSIQTLTMYEPQPRGEAAGQDLSEDEIKKRITVLQMVELDGIEVRKQGSESVCLCPFHDDRNPSLRFYNNKTTKIPMFKCFPCGAVGDVIGWVVKTRNISRYQALDFLRGVAAEVPHEEGDGAPVTQEDGLWVPIPVGRYAPDPPNKHHEHGDPFAIWEYKNAKGAVVQRVLRFATVEKGKPGKEDRPQIWCKYGDDRIYEWRWKWLPADGNRPLYNLDRLAGNLNKPVIVCEGEKATEAASLLFPRRIATTSMGGSGAARGSDWSPLKGRDVLIWPDADVPGRKYGTAVCKLVKEAGALKIRTISYIPSDGGPIPKGFDSADAVGLGITNKDIADHIRVYDHYDATLLTVPTYPDYGVPARAAKKPLSDAVKKFFSAVVDYNEANYDKAKGETVPIPTHGIQVGIGGGKTEMVLKRVAAFEKQDWSGLIFVPAHSLSIDISERLNTLAKKEICRVWFGHSQPDPESSSGKAMCYHTDQVRLHESAGGKISDLCGEEGEGVTCKNIDDCGYQKQLRDHSKLVWVLPSVMATNPKPPNVKPLDFIVFDESPVGSLLGGLDIPYVCNKTELFRGDVCVVKAFELATKRPVFRGTSNFHRDDWLAIGTSRCAEFVKLENKNRLYPQEIVYSQRGEPAVQSSEFCDRVRKHNLIIDRRVHFWRLLENFLKSKEDVSANLELNIKGDVLMCWCDEVHSNFKGPTLILDATLDVDIIRQFFSEFKLTASVKIESPYCRRIQVTDSQFAKGSWVPDEDTSNFETQKANVKKFLNFIEVLRWRYLNDGIDGIDVLVICQMGLDAYLSELYKKQFMDSRVRFEHYNNVRGVDIYKGVRCLVLLGRPLPAVDAVARTAGVIFGEYIPPWSYDSEETWYPAKELFLRMNDGEPVPVSNPYHPDDRCQAILTQICHAEIMQAEGRGRGSRRTETDPIITYILTNMCIDLTISKTRLKDDLLDTGSGLLLMRARGIVPKRWAEVDIVLGSGGGARDWFRYKPRVKENERLKMFWLKHENGPNMYYVKRWGGSQACKVVIFSDDPEKVVKAKLGNYDLVDR